MHYQSADHVRLLEAGRDKSHVMEFQYRIKGSLHSTFLHLSQLFAKLQLLHSYYGPYSNHEAPLGTFSGCIGDCHASG